MYVSTLRWYQIFCNICPNKAEIQPVWMGSGMKNGNDGISRPPIHISPEIAQLLGKEILIFFLLLYIPIKCF